MSNQYLFFCVNPGNENLLKEELRVFYPELALSYSRKGFLTFKNKGVRYDVNSISQLEVAFSTRAGICLGKAAPESVLETAQAALSGLGVELPKCVVHNFSINTDFAFNGEKVFGRDVNEYAPINKTVVDVMALGENEIWLGLHKVGKGTTNYPNSLPDNVTVPDGSPSRAYLKIAQAVKLFHIHFEAVDTWLDFGCAPGGASSFLLEKGCKVYGVDPAEMADTVADNERFTHLKKPVQDLSQEELPERVNWVYAELNLNPKQSIKEVLRLIKKYNFTLKGVLFTVPIVKLNQVECIEEFEEQFYDWGFVDIVSRQLPSHGQEYLIIAKR